MRIVVLASRKGGSGKTILAGHLAVPAELSGAGPVALVDSDPQGSLADWWNLRAAAVPNFVQARLDELPGASRSASEIAQLWTYLESRLERQPQYPGMAMVPGFAAPTPSLSAFGATGA